VDEAEASIFHMVGMGWQPVVDRAANLDDSILPFLPGRNGGWDGRGTLMNQVRSFECGGRWENTGAPWLPQRCVVEWVVAC
jgi:hypothetical protein